MNAFQRSWQITKLTLNVMKADKELFLFPLLAGVFSILFIIAMVFPTILTSFVPTGAAVSDTLFYGVIFLIYLGLSFIAIFFNVCVVYTAKTRFDGGNATFMESLKFAFSKIHLIFMWAMISATVGLILRLLENAANRMEGIGKIMMKIFIGLLGGVWSFITIFVVPGMVYHNLGPFAAIKSSVQTLKKTWGESLIRYYGLGLIQLVFIIGGGVLFVLLAFLTASIAPLFWTILAIAVLYFVAVIVFFNLANSIFNTALYAYASTGKLPEGFDKEVLANAFHRTVE